MNEIEHYEMQESTAMGQAIEGNFRAILANHNADSLSRLQRNCHKYTDAGVSVSFQLFDGSYVWVGDSRAGSLDLVNQVVRVGVSSIVEGSDAEVPLTWIDLSSAKYLEEGGEQLAVEAFNKLLSDVDDEACALWNEANEEAA